MAPKLAATPPHIDYVKDATSIRIVENMFKRYVSEEDFSALPGWMVSVDKIVAKYVKIIEKLGEKNLEEEEEDPKDARRQKQQQGSDSESESDSEEKAEGAAKPELDDDGNAIEDTNAEAEEEQRARADNGDDDEPLQHPVMAWLKDLKGRDIGHFLSLRAAQEIAYKAQAAVFDMDTSRDAVKQIFADSGYKIDEMVYVEASNTLVIKLASGEVSHSAFCDIQTKMNSLLSTPMVARLGSAKGKMIVRFIF